MGDIRSAFDAAFPDGPSGAPSQPDKPAIRQIGTTIETAVEGAAAGEVRMETWAALAAVAGTRAGQPAEIPEHRDWNAHNPVAGGTVPNPGFYRWSISPAGCAPSTGGAAGAPALAQLDACKSATGFYMSTPKYIFRMDDSVHLQALDYAVLGEYQAKAWRRINFNVPRGALAFEFDLLPEDKNYGFEYADDSASATISSVAITGPAQVTLTLSNTPTGANKKVRYAYTGINLGSGTRSGAWGNLRDSDTEPSFQDPGRLLRNCVSFEEVIS